MEKATHVGKRRAGPSVPLGHVAGIPIAADWSALVLLLLLTEILALVMLPDAVPDRAGWAYWLTALSAGILLLASLLAHELAHALVAHRQGMGVTRVTLWMLGGVTELEGETSSPRAELRVALAGPLLSVASSVGFLLAWVVTRAADGTPLLQAALGWLAWINAVLAVFNLLPGAPLDGGRVLRAVLWRRYGDRDRAAIIASETGRRLGMALIVLGFLALWLGDFSGLWLALVGWFLVGSATSEAAAARLRRAVIGLTAADVMSRDPVTLPSWITLAEVGRRLTPRQAHHAYPVTDLDGEPVGLVTMTAISRVPVPRREHTRVRDVCVGLGAVPVVTPNDPLSALLARTSATWTDGLALVAEDHRLVGVISPADLARLVRLSNVRPAADTPRIDQRSSGGTT